MIHKLEPVLDHPTYQMQEYLLITINAAVNGIPFSQSIFPLSLRSNWSQNSQFIEKLENILYSYISNLSDKEVFKRQFLNNNNIKYLCNNATFELIDKIAFYNVNGTQNDLHKFFLYCYGALDSKLYCADVTSTKARKEFDEKFRKKNKYVCPFCGLNKYPNNLGDRRADFDHYLYKGSYPMSAGNMHNLIPMCDECNRDVKKTKNIFYDNVGRTYAFYPYDNIPELSFKIECLIEPNMKNCVNGEWKIIIEPINKNNLIIKDQIQTWDRVFYIKQRYINDIKEFHEEWILSALDDKLEEFEDLSALKLFFQTKISILNKVLQRKMQEKVLIKIIFFKFMQTTASNRFLNRFLQSHNNKLNA